jgi:hypothetical protein
MTAGHPILQTVYSNKFAFPKMLKSFPGSESVSISGNFGLILLRSTLGCHNLRSDAAMNVL